MRGYLILTLLYVTIILISSWNQSDIMSNLKATINRTDFREYFIQKTTQNSQQSLIIFGGYSLNKTSGQKTLSNGLYIINLSTGQTKQLALINNIQPTSRYASCGTIVTDKLFIYGGYTESGELSNELWQYSFTTDRWTLRGTSLTFRVCEFMIITNSYSNDTVALVGLLNSDSTLKFVEYLISNSTFIYNIEVQAYNSVQITTTMWDGSLSTSYLRIQSLEDLIGSNVVSNPQVHFPITYFCLIYMGTNFYYLVTNNGMYEVKKVDSQYQIRFWYQRNQQEIDSQIYCDSINDWYFFIQRVKTTSDTTLYDIVIEYLYAPTYTGGIIHRNKKNLNIDWIDPVEFNSYFSYNNSTFIITQNLQIFYLNQNCDSQMTENTNVFKCAFGMYSCIQGWTGVGCNISSCEGSLRMYDVNNFTLVDVQCSDNGQCLSTGCQCSQNWGGPMCQIYQKKNCQGTMLQNFIASNCECNEATTGGNQCDVVFCYNDCSGKGTCQNNGSCTCNDGYTGPDCSIMQITFSLIS